ncbi:MAG: crossover junction endodeoxyribonuclease RuvC [Pseudomonadota bacterium]|nr:crossover junction endodeoxyribonuclease RuvC [Pseudomonadota bacterium]
MRVLGVDPGSRITGFGVIEIENGELRYITSGCIKMKDRALPTRLKTIFEGISEIIKNTRPDFMAIEEVFVSHNARSALILGQARGAAISAGVSSGLAVGEYTALQIKKSVVGYGQADKAQVQHMVRSILALGGIPQEDAADALACAICHSHTLEHNQRMSKQQGMRSQP